MDIWYPFSAPTFRTFLSNCEVVEGLGDVFTTVLTKNMIIRSKG